MKPRERRETGAQDMFRSRLDQIIHLKHELVTLSKTVSWSFIEAKCGEVYAQGSGMPPPPSMAAPHAATGIFAIAIKH